MPEAALCPKTVGAEDVAAAGLPNNPELDSVALLPRPGCPNTAVLVSVTVGATVVVGANCPMDPALDCPNPNEVSQGAVVPTTTASDFGANTVEELLVAESNVTDSTLTAGSVDSVWLLRPTK